MAYWLMKSEPDVYSIDQLKKDKTTCWDGVRNYQARNMMRDDMRKGDGVLFYHSNCAEPGIVGIAEVSKEGYPDTTIYKGKGNPDPDNPTWYMVDIRYRRKLKRTITLAEIKAEPALADMQLVKRGNRLSVMPVSAADWEALLALE
ncbi:MAG: EVE domain-containing protein [Gammaproteobacteria bacterium]|jgi:predicted RNA-binding protein with PUA-like domain|nr:EVE domain-containing protein [Gammaproteobacteria bacterium]